MFGVTKSVSTPGRAALVSFTNQALKNVPQDHTTKLLESFQRVTKEQVLDALKRYFLPVFDARSSVAVVVTAPGKADTVAKDLEAMGFQVEKRTVAVEAGEGEDGEDSEDGSYESGSESESSER